MIKFNQLSNTVKITIAVAIILILFISIKSCIQNKTRSENLKVLNDSLNIKFTSYRDKDSLLHARIRVLEISNQDLQSGNENLKQHYDKRIDSFSKVLNVKNKQIDGYLTIISKTEGKGEGIIEKVYITKEKTIDTTFNIKSNDGYLSYNGSINKNKFSYVYNYTDTLNQIIYHKNKGLFGLRKEKYYDIYLSNKNTKIVGVEQFSRISNSEYKRFSVVVGTSYGFDNQFKPQWFPVTITVGYKLFEF